MTKAIVFALFALTSNGDWHVVDYDMSGQDCIEALESGAWRDTETNFRVAYCGIDFGDYGVEGL